jgi:hypothetical protein
MVGKAIIDQETLTLEEHTHPVLSVSFSPEGKRIVFCSRGGENTPRV